MRNTLYMQVTTRKEYITKNNSIQQQCEKLLCVNIPQQILENKEILYSGINTSQDRNDEGIRNNLKLSKNNKNFLLSSIVPDTS